MIFSLNPEIVAQEPVVFEEWASAEGVQEYFYKNVTKTDASRNVYVAGATLNSNGDYDLLITKFNQRGILQWTDTVAGPGGGHDFATDLDFDQSGNVVVGGSVAAGGSEGNNILVVKYNSAGTELWRYSHDHNGNNEGAASLVVDGDNSIYLTGATLQSTGYTDMITLKIDSNATLLWEEVTDYNNLHDAGIRIELSGAHAIVTGGGQLNSLTWKVWAMSFSRADGTEMGSTSSSGTDPGVEEVMDLVIDDNDNIYIAGSTINGMSGYDMLLIKLDDDLNIEWTVEWDGDGLTDKASGVRVAPNGDVYLCGTTETATGHDFALIKYNSDGNIVWEEIYDSEEGGDDSAVALEWQDGGYLYMTGNTYQVSNLDYLTLKYDSTGALIWEISYNSPYNKDDKATNLAIDDDGDIIVSGQCAKSDSVMTYYTLKYVERYIEKPNIKFAESELVSFEKNAWQLRYPDSVAATTVKYFTDRTVVPQYFQNDRISFVTNNYAGDTILADTLDRFDLILDKGTNDLKVRGFEKTDFYKNYYLGSGVQPVLRNYHYRTLYYESPWEGFDFHAQKDSLGDVKYTLACSAQADLSAISFELSGHQSINVDSLGQLHVMTTVDTVIFTAPSAYILDSVGESQALTWSPTWEIVGQSSVEMDGNTENETFFIEFGVATVPPPASCTVDYQQNNCAWSTYYGAGAGEQARGLDVTNENKFLLLKKTAMDVPPLTFIDGVDVHYNPINESVYLSNYGYVEIVNFDIADDIEWISVYGGAGELRPTDLKYFEGHTYFAGYTIHGGVDNTIADNLYITENADQPVFGGGVAEAFVARCDEGGFIDWSTYLGGEGYEEISTIEIDADNSRVLVAGRHATNSCESCLEPIDLDGAYNNGVYDGIQGFIASYKFETFEKNWLAFLGNQEVSGDGPYPGGVTINDMTVIDSKLFLCGKLFNLRFGVSQLAVPITSSFQFPFGGPSDAHLETTSGEGIGTGFVTEFDMENYSISWSTALAGSNPTSTFFGGESAVAITGREDVFGRVSLAVAMASTDASLALMNQLSSNGFYQPTNPNYGSSNGNPTTALVKFSSRQVDWATYFGTYNEDVPSDIYMDMDQNIFLSGYTTTTGAVDQSDYCSVNPPQGFPLCSSSGLFFIDPTFNFTSSVPQMDGFISAFNSSNELIWSTFYGGATAGDPPDDFVSHLAQHPVTLELYGAGTTQGGCFPIFEQPLAYNQPNHGLGHFDAFVNKFDLSSIYITTSLDEETNQLDSPKIEIFPNPGNQYLHLIVEDDQILKGIDIYDVRGVRMKNENSLILNKKAYSFDTSQWARGLYLIQVTGSNWSVTKKWIKQ